jgi:hypothetical protein
MMRVLVCGSREYDDYDQMCAVLNPLKDSISVIIQGNADGADCLARMWAVFNKIQKISYQADWETYGRKAGPIRNQRMLDDGKPDLVIAFPGGRGTADMVKRARRAGVEVREIASNPPHREVTND